MATTEIGVERFGLFIGGASRAAASGATFTRESPYDGALVAEYANGDEHDAREAVAAARRAFDDGPWPDGAARERFLVLQRTAELLEGDADRMAALIVRETASRSHRRVGRSPLPRRRSRTTRAPRSPTRTRR